jgi:type II secretory pathway pseudopilin PulG
VKRFSHPAARQAGISYIEVLIATLLILITLLPMMDAMQGATVSAGVHEEATLQGARLQATMERVMSEPFAQLEAAAIVAGKGGNSFDQPSSYSDAQGEQYRRIVYLSLFDGDNADLDDNPFTGADPDLFWIRTELEGTRLAVESLVYR